MAIQQSVKSKMYELDIIIDVVYGTNNPCMFHFIQENFHKIGTGLYDKLQNLRKAIQLQSRSHRLNHEELLRAQIIKSLEEAKTHYIRLNDVYHKPLWLIHCILRINEIECDLFMKFDQGIIHIICAHIPICCDNKNHYDFNKRKNILFSLKKELDTLQSIVSASSKSEYVAKYKSIYPSELPFEYNKTIIYCPANSNIY